MSAVWSTAWLLLTNNSKHSANMINTNIGLLCLLSVSTVSPVERYTYRLLTPSASPSPARPPVQRQYQPRISRQLDIREDPTGPYLNKDSFFSAGFLEDLFGLGRPAEPTVSFQGKTDPSLSVRVSVMIWYLLFCEGKREIAPGSQPSHFPSFFAPVRSGPSPAFLPSSPYQPHHPHQPYHSHHHHQSPQPPPPPPPTPVQQYHHSPHPVKITRNDDKEWDVMLNWRKGN